METKTIREAAVDLSKTLDVPIPQGGSKDEGGPFPEIAASSDEFRLSISRMQHIDALQKSLVRLATEGKLPVRYPNGGFREIHDVTDSSQVNVSEARSALVADGWEFSEPSTEPVAIAQRPDADGGAPTPQNDDQEPFLQKGKNSRAGVKNWIEWQANRSVVSGANAADLAEKILVIANSYGYESERGKMTIANITRMIPAGLTGGRRKNRHKKKTEK